MRQHPTDEVFATLVRERGPALTGYAFLLTGDRAAAQDLVQDALIKVFVRARTGFTPDIAEAYVRRAVLTLFVDGYRRRRHFAGLRHLVAVPDHDSGVEPAAADRIDLRAALASLTPQERACIVLRFYEDLTVPDITDALGLAGGTVKRYLSNAIGKLEQRLGAMPQLHDTGDVDTVAVLRHTTSPERSPR